MAALSSFAKGAARSGAEGSCLPYIDIGTDFRPLSLPRQQALALRDAIVACHEREGTGSSYRRQRLMDCGNPVSGGAEAWVYKCNLPECPLCYRRRAYRKAAEAARMDAVLKESGFVSQMLTISMPDTEAEGMAARYAELAADCARLYRSKTYLRRIAGAARCIETSIADTGLFHVHIHLLLLFHCGVLPAEIVPLVRRCFPSGEVYASELWRFVCTARFAAYGLKLPQGVTAEEWLSIRQMMQGKMPLTFSGVLRRARREGDKRRPPKRKCHEQ